jgi:hypothetical protein
MAGRTLNTEATTAVVSGSSTVAAANPPTVVLHVDDHVYLDPVQRAVAEAEATRIYRAAGIYLKFVDGCAASRAYADGLAHLTIVITREAAAQRRANSDGFDANVAGHAAREASRAYVYYSPVLFAAARRARDVGSVLGMVIAHEIGHLLLPEKSHSHVGIMRPDLNLTSLLPQEFTTSQSAAIRAKLSGGIYAAR